MTRAWHSITLGAVVAVLATAATFGQARKPAARTGGGLAALSDEAVLAELAGRQMQGLLDHAFTVNKVPQEQREAMLAIPAIKRLGDPKANLKDHERLALIRQVAAGAERVVAAIDDPKVLMEHSATLIEYGVRPEVNLMEYWGETPKVQKRLEPVIKAVMDMLDKAIKTGTAERSKLEEQLNQGRNTKVENAWTEADKLVTTAEYTRAMVKYNEALAIPATKAGLEKRKAIADGAIEFLQAYDNGESGIQAAVRNRLAKLNMVKHEYGPANDLFESVVSGQVDDKNKIEPPAQPFEQYEARYFSVVAELMQGDIPRATQGLEDVITWQKANVQDAAVQGQLDAAADMLRYRIAMKEAEKAKSPAAKKAAQEKGFAVLMELNQKQPRLAPIIAEQLIEAMGEDVDLKKSELLIVQAIYSRGVQAAESVEEPGKADPTVVKQIEQAVDAAREVMARKDPKVGPVMLANMTVQIPKLYEKIGRNLEAAMAYLDYVEKKQGSPENMKAAFERAGYLLSNLVRAGGLQKDQKVADAWERFLPIAIDQFKHTELAFDHAERLRRKNPTPFAEAVKYYRLVPKTDKRYRTAKSREMLTLTNWIYAADPKDAKKPLLDPAARAAKIQETLKVADEVRELTTEGIKTAKEKAEQLSLRNNLALVTLTQAELATLGEKPDWERVLKIVENFEDQSKGLDNESALNRKVMELRVYAYRQLKQFNKAADVLIALLQNEPGGRASGMVLGILQQLNNDYDRAIKEGKTEEAREILADRSKLSGRLVDWANTNADANVKKNLYVYKVYDADTQRLYGASLEGDERTTQLNKAMDAFKTMRSPENVAAYQAFVAERQKENPQDKTDPNDPDPAVTLGMALTSYDLKDWKTAAKELKRLSYFAKFGSRNRTEIDPKTNEVRTVSNEQYWEGTYKYYESTRQWAAADPGDKDAQAELGAVKTLLRRDYVAGPDEVGGEKWRDGFEALRKELIPDLDLDALRKLTPNAPSSQPAPVAAN